MSAWIVSKGHIDCLVQALAVERIVTFDQADAVGTALWRENHRSVNARYGEATRTPHYEFHGVEAPLDSAIVFKQVACYEYQTCEHDGWERSWAHTLMSVLRERLLAQLGKTGESVYDAMWDAAPWGIDSIEEAVAKGVHHG